MFVKVTEEETHSQLQKLIQCTHIQISLYFSSEISD